MKILLIPQSELVRASTGPTVRTTGWLQRLMRTLFFVAAIGGSVQGTGSTLAGEAKYFIVQPIKAQGDAVLLRIGLTLPPSATVEYAEEINGLDEAARLTAVLSDDDCRRLLASLPVAEPGPLILSPDANFHLGPDEGRWLPGREKQLKTVQLPWRAGMESLNLGVAPADPGHTRLFIFWHRL